MAERQTGEDTGKSTLTGRRSYLKLLGASAAAVAAGATGVSAAASDYETVKVPAGETKVVSVGTGDTLENVLYDVTASGAHVLIRAWGDDWTIRNVGIKGAMEEFDGNVVAAGVDDPNSSAVVENFYLGDGLVNYASSTPRTAPSGSTTTTRATCCSGTSTSRASRPASTAAVPGTSTARRAA
ncbi:hypothetical protein ACFQH6_10125 [Halobacteriaceae archaeon GCM10025711]